MTKLYCPPPRPVRVARPRLQPPHLANAQHRLTLITAPAGFGKTTLAAEWRSPHFAWLSLDDEDNDPARFVAYLAAACQQIFPHVGQQLQPLLQSGQTPDLSHLLTYLINDLATSLKPPATLTLVLDDYHLIHNDTIHQAMTTLVEHAPPGLHLILTSRTEPALPLARWRARGWLTDIRADDLRFDQEETAYFLQEVMGLKLDAAAIHTLARRTEGWVASLQLAALSLQNNPDPAAFLTTFGGHHRAIFTYLTEEILNHLPDDGRDFLLCTAIVGKFNQELAEDLRLTIDDLRLALPPLTPQSSIVNLKWLVQHNLFLTPLDENQTWYRYHHLFAEALQEQLRHLHPDWLVPLHRRASAWFEQHDQPAEAIQHALAAADYPRAAHLIDLAADKAIRRGEIMTIHHWLQALPKETVRSHAGLCIWYGWIWHFQNQPEQAEAYLQTAESLPQIHPAALGQIAVIRAFMANRRGRTAEMMRHSQEALAILSPEHVNMRALIGLNLGGLYRQQGNLAESEAILLEAETTAQQGNHPFIQQQVLGQLAELRLAQGRLTEVVALSQRTLNLLDQHGLRSLSGSHLLRLGYVYWQWDDRAAAATILQETISQSQLTQESGVMRMARLILAAVHRAEGEWTESLAEIDAAAQLLPLSQTHPWAAYWLVRSWLAHGQLAQAQRWLPHPHQAKDWTWGQLAWAHFCLARQRGAEAMAWLHPLHQMSERDGRQFLNIETGLLLALAYQQEGDQTRARYHLTDALCQAEPERFIRLFLEMGQPLAELLATLPGTDNSRYLLDRLENRALPPTTPAELAEPLSGREQEILHLVAHGLSTRAIAAQLTLGPSTVKWHIQNVYSKLGVHRRTQAVARGRELGLLD